MIKQIGGAAQTLQAEPIYFDNSATTPLCPEAITAMERVMQTGYGNPSALYRRGLIAQNEVHTAREKILSLLGVHSAGTFSPLVFTACGTEANNLALFGTARAKAQHKTGKIIVSDSEHPSVLRCAQALEAQGIRVLYLPTRGGLLDLEMLSREVTQDTFLVSLMTVNNETGALYDVARAAHIAKEKNPAVVVHTDAVQAFGRLPVTPEKWGVDLVSLSAHKIGGPKGVGALYISPAVHKAKKIIPVLLGGGQEQGYRSGTENVIGIAGFGAAAAAIAKCEQPQPRIRAYLCNVLRTDPRFSAVVINEAPQGHRAGHILSLTLPGIRSETMLHFLSDRGICISAGSACSSASRHISPALQGFGLNAKQAATTVRISIGPQNTLSQADALLAGLAAGLERLART